MTFVIDRLTARFEPRELDEASIKLPAPLNCSYNEATPYIFMAFSSISGP